MQNNAYEIRTRRIVHDGFARYEQVTVLQTHSNGSRAERVLELHDHGSAVAVLPIDSMRQVGLLVRQPRLPVLLMEGRDRLIEAAAGLRDPGETLEDAARREAREELGIELRALTFIANPYMTPGVVTERTALFLADYTQGDWDAASGGGLVDEGEDIEVLEWPLSKMWDAVSSGEIRDAKTLLLIQAARLRDADLFV